MQNDPHKERLLRELRRQLNEVAGRPIDLSDEKLIHLIFPIASSSVDDPGEVTFERIFFPGKSCSQMRLLDVAELDHARQRPARFPPERFPVLDPELVCRPGESGGNAAFVEPVLCDDQPDAGPGSNASQHVQGRANHGLHVEPRRRAGTRRQRRLALPVFSSPYFSNSAAGSPASTWLAARHRRRCRAG